MLVALVAVFCIGAVVLWRSGAATPEAVRAWLDSLGAFGPVLFIAAFILGAFVGVPGMAFVVGGILAFGPVGGAVLGYAGGLAAVSIPFVTARRLRKDAPPWQPKSRLAARAVALLDRHPLRAVLLLRLILWFNPPLSYALAFSGVTTRTYLLGCALALAPVVTIATVLTHAASEAL